MAGRARMLFPLLLGAMAIGCSPRDAGQPEGKVTGASALRTIRTYDCEDGFQFVAEVRGDTAWVLLPDTTVVLPHVPSASGAKYASAGFSYLSQGEEAVVGLGDREYSVCRMDQPQGIWRDAKLRGVDFRAIGQEPGWMLEIDQGREILLIADYGEKKHTFPAPEPQVEERSATRTYVTRSGGHELVVRIEDQPCRDGMSGLPFETTVTATLDGHSYFGCGRTLR